MGLFGCAFVLALACGRDAVGSVFISLVVCLCCVITLLGIHVCVCGFCCL